MSSAPVDGQPQWNQGLWNLFTRIVSNVARLHQQQIRPLQGGSFFGRAARSCFSGFGTLFVFCARIRIGVGFCNRFISPGREHFLEVLRQSAVVQGFFQMSRTVFLRLKIETKG